MKSEQYQPDPIAVPPLYVWPPRPVAALKWLTIDLMAPWGIFWIALAVLIYFVATPSPSTAESFSLGWVAPYGLEMP